MSLNTDDGADFATVDVGSLKPTTGDNVAVTSVVADGESETYPVYETTTVTYTASDKAGNSASCSFTVTVSGKSTINPNYRK